MFVVAPYKISKEFKPFLKKHFGGQLTTKIYYFTHTEELETEVLKMIPDATIFVNPERYLVGKN